jgi:branched-chain amino acid transport system substrate-binding protein
MPWGLNVNKCIPFALLLIMMGACSSPETIKIGIIAGLTGRVADLGTAGRDGAILAAEEANSQGGVGGSLIELVIRDDKQDEQECRQAMADLVEEKVVAVVGPMTSSMALVVAPEINRHAIPTISPTVSTSKLAGIDDYFFRIIPVSSDAAIKAAEYTYLKKNYRNIFVVFDAGNSAYTASWYRTLKTHFELLGAGTVEGLSYISSNGADFLKLAETVAEKKADCLVILANALDTAMISQQLAKLGVDVPLIASEWSLTEDLLEYGGQAVNGMVVFHSFNRNDISERYLSFSGRFQERFGYPADFASAYAYNATKILIDAMRDGTSPRQMKKNILDGSPYDGVQTEIHFNQYGDAEREYNLLQIQDGKVITL